MARAFGEIAERLRRSTVEVRMRGANAGGSGVIATPDGKIVTNAHVARGGAATVRLFRQAGARVAFSYRQAAGQANALSAACGGPYLCLPIQQSLETPEDGEALVSRTLNAFGDLGTR